MFQSNSLNDLVRVRGHSLFIVARLAYIGQIKDVAHGIVFKPFPPQENN